MKIQLERWLKGVALIALLKQGIAFMLILDATVNSGTSVTPRLWLFTGITAVFAACGGMLLWGARTDRRAGFLGLYFLFVGSSFSEAISGSLLSQHGLLAATLGGIMALQVDAASAYVVWRFVQEFPRLRAPTRSDSLIRASLAASLVLGVILFVANALRAAAPFGSALALTVQPLSRRDATGAYWSTQYVLLLSAFVAMVWRTRLAVADERRRARLLIFAVVMALLPGVVIVLLTSIAPAAFVPMFPLRIVGWIVYPAILSIPFTTAYAVLVHRALDVRLIVRRAVQYALARYSVAVFALVPFLVLVISGYRNRNQRLGDLLSSPSHLAVALLGCAGLAIAITRGWIMRRIDRRFFREQYDARSILGRLVEECRAATTIEHLCVALESGIDRALHLEAVHALVVDGRGQLVSPRAEIRALDGASRLARELSLGNAVETDMERPSAFIERLEGADLDWITDANVRLLLPLRDSDRSLLGCLALGPKRSELPFSAEDRELLTLVTSAAEMSVAYGRLLPSDEDRRTRELGDHEFAVECTGCGAVQASGSRCVACDAETVPSLVPAVVAGKLAIERRIGTGGMGVVYRGVDTQLGRPVAVKTLPHVSAAAAVRLRREARAIAAVSHSNLALIYGAETWRGRPMLVFEYLSGGTLADRLAHGPLALDAALDIGISVARVLGAIHRAGVLHRDIKPSNIGFSSDGTVKLLDFGLARVLNTIAEPSGTALGGPRDATSIVTTDSLLQGTPLYMSPEALLGAAPDERFDLWSLCMVIYEAIAGIHPARAVANEGQGAYHPFAIPDVSQLATSTPGAVALFLADALSLEISKRPRSAADLERELTRLRAGIGVGRPDAMVGSYPRREPVR